MLADNDSSAFNRLAIIVVMIAAFITGGVLCGVSYLIWRMFS